MCVVYIPTPRPRLYVYSRRTVSPRPFHNRPFVVYMGGMHAHIKLPATRKRIECGKRVVEWRRWVIHIGKAVFYWRMVVVGRFFCCCRCCCFSVCVCVLARSELCGSPSVNANMMRYTYILYISYTTTSNNTIHSLWPCKHIQTKSPFSLTRSLSLLLSRSLFYSVQSLDIKPHRADTRKTNREKSKISPICNVITFYRITEEGI